MEPPFSFQFGKEVDELWIIMALPTPLTPVPITRAAPSGVVPEIPLPDAETVTP